MFYQDYKDDKLRIIERDPWLKPYEHDLRLRRNRFFTLAKYILSHHGSFKDFAAGHLFFGIHKTPHGFVYREWAPAAKALFLIGDFNGWNRESHPLERQNDGHWEIFLPYEQYAHCFTHGSRIKVRVIGADHSDYDRIPLYIRRVIQDEYTKDFSGQVWFPEQDFLWHDAEFVPQCHPLLIYEAHVGMAQDREGIGTYREFAELILPRIKNLGYNAVQLMGIMEHPYYGSFGYHVSNFFAASSRFGTPEDLKYLIQCAHDLGIAVLLDIVHSHAVKNINEGINCFDGTVYQFFHSGGRGDHPAWDSKLFDYGKLEVCHFLASNVRFWLEEYHFDGFRFDGVTSMLYHHHGLGHAFNHYGKYFSMDTDVDAVLYLQLANAVAHEVKPECITVAEDMSGMPGMCLPIDEGGIGFDYRLAMGIPDFWIRTLRSKADEDWNLYEMWHELTTRRPGEKNVGYAESHDQALVGDKTIAFWLMDAAMYWHMSIHDKNLVIDRGIALHKMIRLVTSSLGGEGYLNFMGNEFGHPEWIDFPREGNNWSYKYARRQWHLVDNHELKYKYLNEFDKAMIALLKSYNVLEAQDLQQLWLDNEQKILIYRKGGLIFAFNFHPNRSVTDFEFPLWDNNTYKVVLCSDDEQFGGHNRIDLSITYPTFPRGKHLEPPFALRVYIPCRTAFVLAPV